MSKFEDVCAFHRKMGFWPYVETHNSELRASVLEKRKKLIKEESEELIEALDSGDLTAILHEAIDVMYVAMGSLIESGIEDSNLQTAWQLVHAANMEKIPPDDPLGKAEKGPKWKKADVAKAFAVKKPLSTYLVTYTYENERFQKYENTYISMEGGLTSHRVNEIIFQIETSMNISGVVILAIKEVED